MRLTKDIKHQILANILRDHEIATEAKQIMMDSRDLAYAITLDCMPDGIRTFAALTKKGPLRPLNYLLQLQHLRP
ncbi:hypothetical protein JL1_57 [Escherichia phage JL1]|uniref:Nucleotide modification associated domain-containing protein n=1 Tax=Escherichia phage JL1 TaxID=2681620 RepID=K4NWX7_9CAUD|nr:hypothetical protein D873_gp57 [Escherichia phage JL1]AFV51274.1 hypothetical protein JL1_57 [Escherichia phage JL1]